MQKRKKKTTKSKKKRLTKQQKDFRSFMRRLVFEIVILSITSITLGLIYGNLEVAFGDNVIAPSAGNIDIFVTLVTFLSGVSSIFLSEVIRYRFIILR